jgi:hypothetical protein
LRHLAGRSGWPYRIQRLTVCGDNRYAVALPQVTWTAPSTGKNTASLTVVYDADTGAGTDSNLLVLTHHIFAVTADGNDVVLNAGDFFRAS